MGGDGEFLDSADMERRAEEFGAQCNAILSNPGVWCCPTMGFDESAKLDAGDGGGGGLD